jgi:hypothetical protein
VQLPNQPTANVLLVISHSDPAPVTVTIPLLPAGTPIRDCQRAAVLNCQNARLSGEKADI